MYFLLCYGNNYTSFSTESLYYFIFLDLLGVQHSGKKLSTPVFLLQCMSVPLDVVLAPLSKDKSSAVMTELLNIILN